MIRARQHWMIFVRPGPVTMVLSGLILTWAALSPASVSTLLHITRASPAFILEILRTFYENRVLCAGVPLALAALMILTTWGVWSISFFEVDDYAFTYRTGPFVQNTVPLRAIQDIRTNTSVLGLMFGYGTLILDSGRTEEILDYVPRLDEFITALRGRP